MEQRTQEWHQARTKKVTSSRFKDILYGSEKSWNSYMELLDNYSEENKIPIHAKSIKWGIEKEDRAKAYIKLIHNVDVRDVGFLLHPKYDFIGCSPDGSICVEDKPDTFLEIKCPFDQQEHMQVVHSKKMPNKYMPQVQGAMWVTGGDHYLFVSFDPRQKGVENKLVSVSVKRDDLFVKKLEKRILEFWECYNGTRNASKYFDISNYKGFIKYFNK